MKKPTIAVIGCGYWGPNLIRNFHQLHNCTIKTCCDMDPEKTKRIENLYPGIQTTSSVDDILNDPEIDGVAIATPVHTHETLGMKCLEHGKHVLIEKPLANSVAACQNLINKAEEMGKVLMVGHTFEYTAAVNKAKEIIDSGELGEIYYISCQRVNLGLFQPDINVIWDLAPHDISILLYLLNENPSGVNAQGRAHFKENIEDVATMTLNFPSGTIAFIHNSWVDPAKIRKITIVGSKKMLVYDDIKQNEKIKIYDKGVQAPPYYDTYAEFHFSYRYGDIFIPHIKEYEPLRRECEEFIGSIQNNRAPKTDGYNGLRVVSILEASTRSIRNKGTQESLNMEMFVKPGSKNQVANS